MNDDRFPVEEVIHTQSDNFYRVYGGFRYEWVDETQQGALIGEPSEWFATFEAAREAAVRKGGGELEYPPEFED